jgi:hypothetical protein
VRQAIVAKSEGELVAILPQLQAAIRDHVRYLRSLALETIPEAFGRSNAAPKQPQEDHMSTRYGWQEFYYLAVLETDWSKMGNLIEAAESAIEARLHEFSLNHGGTSEENQAIVDAVALAARIGS